MNDSVRGAKRRGVPTLTQQRVGHPKKPIEPGLGILQFLFIIGDVRLNAWHEMTRRSHPYTAKGGAPEKPYRGNGWSPAIGAGGLTFLRRDCTMSCQARGMPHFFHA